MISKVFKYCLIFLIVLLSILFIAMKIFDITIVVAKNNSMKPIIYENDLLIIKKCDSYNEGDVIEFKYNNLSVTHRIMAKTIDNDTTIYYTLGDNNKTCEIVHESMIKGKVLLTIPKVGVIYSYLDNLLIVITVLFVYFIVLKTDNV